MAFSEVYFKDVVFVSTVPTNEANLGEVILQNVTNKKFPEDTTFYVLCGLEPAKYDQNLTVQFEEMSNNLAEKIESCASDMGYSLAPNIVLKTKETGMYILSQFSCSDPGIYLGKPHVGPIYIILIQCNFYYIYKKAVLGL